MSLSATEPGLFMHLPPRCSCFAVGPYGGKTAYVEICKACLKRLGYEDYEVEEDEVCTQVIGAKEKVS